jgi:ribosomal protein L31E
MDITDKAKKGFGVRVYPSGVRVFIFKYKIDGVQKLLNLGEYPSTTLKSAREEFEKQFTRVRDLRNGKSDGADPVKEIKLQAERRIKEDAEHKQAPTVAGLVKDFIEKHSKKKNRNWKDIERMLNKEVVSEWGKRKAKDISKRDVNILLEKIVDRGSQGIRNYYQKSILSKIIFSK